MDLAICRNLSSAILTQMATWPDLSNCRISSLPAAYLLPWEQAVVQNCQTVPAAKLGLHPLDNGQVCSSVAETNVDTGTRQCPTNTYLQSFITDRWSLKLLHIETEVTMSCLWSQMGS